jgi:hypothetical protein
LCIYEGLIIVVSLNAKATKTAVRNILDTGEEIIELGMNKKDE